MEYGQIISYQCEWMIAGGEDMPKTSPHFCQRLSHDGGNRQSGWVTILQDILEINGSTGREMQPDRTKKDLHGAVIMMYKHQSKVTVENTDHHMSTEWTDADP